MKFQFSASSILSNIKFIQCFLLQTVPGKRPRHCPNGLVDPSHGPPLKSVIVHTDPSKVTASTPGEVEGPAPNLAGNYMGFKNQ